MRWWMRVAGAAAVGLAGCTTGPSTRPEFVEQYTLPANDDPRFSVPTTYPKVREPDKRAAGAAAPGGVPSMRGPGGGGMGGVGGPGF